jgi:glycine cleavage system regulatory protein
VDWLWLVPALPLCGFLILFLSEGRLPDVLVAMIGAGSVGLAALVAFVATLGFLDLGGQPHVITLWVWMDVGGFAPEFRLYLDGLSVVMMGVITGVGFLIHLYATGYMKGEDGYSRFFAYMNLFVFAMLLLVSGNWAAIGKLEKALAKLSEDKPLSISVRKTDERVSEIERMPYGIDIVSLDQPGIVFSLANFFAAQDIEISDLATRRYAAAHTGSQMFAVQMTINVPSTTSISQLRDEFLDLCDQLNLDAILEPVKA